MKPKKILIDLLKLNNLYVGLGQVSLHYGKAIAEMASTYKDELKFTFLVPPNFVNYFGKEVNYQTPNFLKRYFPFLNAGFDIWHSIHQDSAFMPDSRTTFFLTVHDLNFLYEKNTSKAAQKLNSLQYKVDKASSIFSISNFTKHEIENHLTVQNKSIQVIYNGVEPLLNKPSSFPPDLISPSNYLLTIGNITAKKNFHTLISMMKWLPDEILIIAGNDKSEYAQQMKRQLYNEQITNVQLLGEVKDVEKNYLLQNCKAFLFPSLFEGFGLPVIEAMSCGKQVFVSQSTSLPEIVGHYGFYFENFNPESMANLVAHQLSANNQHSSSDLIRYSEQFTWENNAKKYIEFYLAN